MPIRKSKLDPLLVAANDGLAPLPCVRCGKPTHTLSRVCNNCLEARYQAEEIVHMAEALAAFPNTRIELAHDRMHVRHLVSFNAPDRAWCRAELTEARSKRTRAEVGKFPPGLCAKCLEIFDRVMEKKRVLQSQTAE